MKMRSIQVLTLSAALLAAPNAVFGQADASTPAQQNTRGQTGSTDSTQATQDSAGSGMTPAQGRDKMFLRKAAMGGIAEVELGRLAAEKGSADEVKSFGQKMVDDHTALNEDMKPIASSMGVMLPSKPSKKDQMLKDRLSGLSGDAFDKAYLSAMVKDHREDVREFRAEAAATQDPTLKAAVQKGLGVIQEHLRMVTRLAKSHGAMGGGMAKSSAEKS